MDKYLSVNLFKVIEGRPYSLSVPQMRQAYSEVLEVLESFKKEIVEMEQRDLALKEEQEKSASEAPEVKEGE